MNQRKIGTILSYIQNLLHIVISFLYVPLLLGGIGKSEYGLYQLVGSVVAYISIMESLLSSGVLRFYCKYKALNDKLMMENTLAVSKKIYNIFSMLVLIIGIICSFVFRNVYAGALTNKELVETQLMLFVLILNIIVNLKSYVYTAAITAHEEFIFLKILTIFSIIVQPLVILLVIKQWPYAITIVIIQTVINFILAILKILFFKRKLQLNIILHKEDKEFIKQLLVFSAGIFLAALADQIFWKADQLILGKLYGTSVVAVYAIGAQIYSNYMPLGTSITSVFMPKISQLYNEVDGINLISDLFIRTGRLVFFLTSLVLTGFCLYGKTFICLWAGEDYIEAFYVAIIVMIPFTIDLIQNLGLVILQVTNKYSFRGKMYFIIAIINIFSTVILARYYGMKGAAFSTAISMLLGNGLMMNWYYSKKVGLNIKKFWKEIIKIFPTVIIAFCLGKLLEIMKLCNIYLDFGLHVVIYIIIFGTLMYLFAFNDYEKNLIKSFLIKMDRKK